MGINEKIYEVKRRWLPVYLVVLIAIILLILHFGILAYYTKKENYTAYAFMLGLLGSYMGINIAKLLKVPIPKYKILKMSRCSSCGYSVEREVTGRGDYISKEEGSCPKCGGKIVIAGIYRVKIEERPTLWELLGFTTKGE